MISLFYCMRPMLSHMFRLFFELHTLYITVASHFQYHTTALCYCLFLFYFFVPNGP